MKTILVFFLLIIITSCQSNQDRYSVILNEEWQIMKFFHKDEDIALKGFIIIGFERHNKLWFIKRENGVSKFIYADYNFFMKSDTLKIDIKNCSDIRFNSNYNVYIDTVRNFEKQYIIQLTLDSEDSYIQAIRSSLKN
jgi:hypothetical protein